MAFLPSWWDSVSIQAFCKTRPLLCLVTFLPGLHSLSASQNYTAGQTATFGEKLHSLVTRVTVTVLRNKLAGANVLLFSNGIVLLSTE